MTQDFETFGDWLVWRNGAMIHGEPEYYIDACQIDTGIDWVSHMLEKRWVNIDDFKAAYEYAKTLV